MVCNFFCNLEAYNFAATWVRVHMSILEYLCVALCVSRAVAFESSFTAYEWAYVYALKLQFILLALSLSWNSCSSERALCAEIVENGIAIDCWPSNGNAVFILIFCVFRFTLVDEINALYIMHIYYIKRNMQKTHFLALKRKEICHGTTNWNK